MKSVLCLTLFYPFYMVLLSRETFHRFNRMALLSILLASVAIPACRITTEEPMLLSQLYQRWEHWLTGQEETPTATFEIDWAAMEYATTTVVESDMLQLEPTFSLADFLSEHWGDLLFLLYVAGILFLIGRHIASLVRLFGLLRKGKMQRLDNGTRLYLHPYSDIAPFSWMKYIIISEADYRENGHQIVTHEQAHISNHHSWDLLLTEVCLLGQWFNPAAWLLRQELQNIHEYEADDTVLSQGINAKDYQLLIIKKAVGARLYSLANSLNHSSLKKRLTMMMKEKSHPWARLKYLYVLPLAAISMVAFAHTEAVNNSNGISEAKGTEVSANEQTSSVNSSENRKEKILIVVDGKLSILETTAIDWTSEDLAKHIGVTPEEIAQIEVIKKSESLAQWNIPGATGAILVTTKKANKQTFDVTPLENGEKGFKINSSKDSKVIIVLDGKVASVETGLTRFRSNETLADGLGIKSEDIMSIEVITNPDLLAQWNIPDAAGAILVSTKSTIEEMSDFPSSTEELVKKLPGAQMDEDGKITINGKEVKKIMVNGKEMSDFPSSTEELVKKLPGAQMDEDGKITINGKEVKKIMVNGKEFFGGTEELIKKLPGAQMGEDGKITIDGKEVKKIMVNGKEFFVGDQVINTNNSEQAKGTEEGTAKGSDNEEVFMVVEEMPEYPGGTMEMMAYLAKNIKYPTEAQQKNEEGRVIVQFIVGKDGKLSNIEISKSISPSLDAEAIRVIKAMPDWKPGRQRGQAVACKFNLPINFTMDSSKGNNEGQQSDIHVVGYSQPTNGEERVKAVYELPREQENNNNNEIFQVVEKMPEYPGGTMEMLKFLQQNIKYPKQAQKDSIQGRVVVQFIVDKTGKVTSPSIVRSVSPELDAEAIRVINSMPQWTPGEQKGEAVNVEFTLPMQFRL